MSDILSVDHCRLLVQTLGHSLWQASVIAIVCWIVLRSLPARRSSLRYGVACAGLLSVVSSAFTTAVVLSEMHSPEVPQITEHTRLSFTSDPEFREWFQEAVADAGNESAHTQDAHEAAPLAAHGPQSTPLESVRESGQSGFSWLTLLVSLWAAGVLLMLGRVAHQLLAVQRLRRPSGDCDSELLGQLQGIVDDLTTRLKLWFPVRLVVSDRVSVPGMIGTFWPVLLLPPAMLSGVPIEQLRVVIAHELAHARRFDFLVNLGQLIVESLLFFNPAVWWLSRQIRIEREACCDAEAVTATGSAVPVARTLLAIVERLRSSIDVTAADRFAAAAGIQSMTGDGSSNDNSPLFDRVRRIVTPEQRPHVRVPWYTLVGVVVTYCLVSFGLYEGTAVTVQAVQRALSPKERVEKIEQLIAEKGELARREGVPQTPLESDPGKLFPEPVTVSGTVRTADGQPLPRLAVHGTLSGRGYGGSELFGNFRPSDEPTCEFHFQGTTQGQKHLRGDTGTLRLSVGFARDSEAAKRFAPIGAGPFEVHPGQKLENIELVLDPGFDGQLRVLTTEETPIGDAIVAGHFTVDGNGPILNQTLTRTSTEGLTTIPRSTSDLQWIAHIRAAGYQAEYFTLKLSPDQHSKVVLKEARPTTLRLTSADDGQPVTGATAYLVMDAQTRDGSNNFRSLPNLRDDPASYEHRYGPRFTYGPSNASGEIHLDSLSDDSTYEVLILRDGYGPELLTEIGPGQESIGVSLHRPLTVSGQIVGDLSKLRTDRVTGQRYIQYSDTGHDVVAKVTVEEHDGTGRFQIDGLGHGELWLRLPDRSVFLTLTESVDDVFIDLDTPGTHQRSAPVTVLPAPQGATRKVILTLVNANPEVPIAGDLRVGYLKRDNPDAYSSANLDIVDSKIEFDVEVPTKIHWVDRSFTGYSVTGRSGVVVDTGDEPFRLDIPLLPGGAVRGEVRLADGSLARNFQVDLKPVDQKAKYKGTDEDIDLSDPPGEFVLTGVPFDQEYRVLITDERRRSVAAIVSEPFSLSAADPIADLKFQFEEGRTHVIRLLDEDGEPAIGAKADFAFNPGLGFVRSHSWKVNDDATVVFEQVSDAIPGESTFQIEAAGPFRGQKLKLDWSNLPETLTLKRGVAASGQLVDEATGSGVAGAEFFLFPSPSKAAKFRDAVWGKTDDEGRFSFECLEPVTYQLHIHGAVPPRVPFKKNARGVLEPDYSNINDGTFPEWFVNGGNTEPVTIKVKLTPRSRLQLAETGSES